MKTIFSKKQAITVIVQCESEKNPEHIDLFAIVDAKHKYFSLSCEEIEKKLLKYVEKDSFAGVIEQIH